MENRLFFVPLFMTWCSQSDQIAQICTYIF